MKPQEPDFLQDRAQARRVRDQSIAELSICRIAAALQAGFIAAIVVVLFYAVDPVASAVSILCTISIVAYTTWALVHVCRLGVFFRAHIEAIGLFLEGRHAEAVKLLDSAKGEST